MRSRRRRPYAEARAVSLLIHERFFGQPPIRLKDRSIRGARRACEEWAGQWFALARSFDLQKPLEELLAAFVRRFDESQAVGDLLRAEGLPLLRVRQALVALIMWFDDDSVARLPASEILGIGREISEQESRKRERTLSRAAEYLAESGAEDVARRATYLAQRYADTRAEDPSRTKRKRGPGAPPHEKGDLIEKLDLALDPIPDPERHRLIARLVTDFRSETTTGGQVRELLKDRWRRLDRTYRANGLIGSQK